MRLIDFLCLLFLLAVAGLTGCSSHDAAGDAASIGVDSFSTLYSTILAPKCNSCHSTGGPGGGIDLSSYASIMASGSVVPSEPSRSTLYTSVQSGNMPRGMTGLSSAEIGAISSWISRGAPNDFGPRIDSINPTGGPATGLTLVTIRGQGFQKGASVKFGSASCSNTNISSSNEISCLVAGKPSGTDDLTVVNPDGQSGVLRGAYTYGTSADAVGFSVRSVFPRSGPASNLIQLSGNGFVTGATVTVGEGPCTDVVVVPPQELTCVTPPRLESGAVDIIVTNPSGQSTVFVGGYTYVIEASFTSILNNIFIPKCARCHRGGFAQGGVDLTSYSAILGSGIAIPGDWEDSSLYTSVANDSMPQAAAPLSSTEKQAIKNWLINNATDDTPPSVAGIYPPRGSVGGLTLVTIYGNRFSAGATVNIGGAGCLLVTVQPGGTQITCTTSAYGSPITAPTVVDVVVTNPGVSGGQPQRGTGANLFTFAHGPEIASANGVLPASGPSSAHTPITISGDYFETNSTVYIGGRPENGGLPCQNQAVLNSHTITCQTPYHAAGPADVVVINPNDGQFYSASGAFTFTQGTVPTLVSISPTSGYNDASTQVTLTGTGFLPGATVTFVRGNNRSNCPVLDSPAPTSSRLTVQCPANLSVGKNDVIVTNPDAQQATLAAAFTQIQAVLITTISPISGSAFSAVTINGKGFINPPGTDPTQGSLAFLVSGTNLTPCLSTTVNPPGNNGNTSLICVVPAGTSGSKVGFKVLNPDGRSAFTDPAIQFTYN